jgi:hypothetical protein
MPEGKTKVKTFHTHSGLSKWLGEVGNSVGFVSRHHFEHIKTPYAYSPTNVVYKWQGKPVVVKETGHRKYEVHHVPKEALIHGDEEKALKEFEKTQKVKEKQNVKESNEDTVHVEGKIVTIHHHPDYKEYRVPAGKIGSAPRSGYFTDDKQDAEDSARAIHGKDIEIRHRSKRYTEEQDMTKEQDIKLDETEFGQELQKLLRDKINLKISERRQFIASSLIKETNPAEKMIDDYYKTPTNTLPRGHCANCKTSVYPKQVRDCLNCSKTNVHPMARNCPGCGGSKFARSNICTSCGGSNIRMRTESQDEDSEDDHETDEQLNEGPRYSRGAVDQAIASSNRSGRRIGGREAKLIHSLLRGRPENDPSVCTGCGDAYDQPLNGHCPSCDPKRWGLKEQIDQPGEQLNELSKKTLGNYLRKAVVDIPYHSDMSKLSSSSVKANQHDRQLYSRYRGAGRAIKKLTK